MDIEIRPIEQNERRDAWAVLKQLRADLPFEQFETALDIQSRQHGYVLIGAFSDGGLLGVLGMRPMHTFARGAHLHVDDLVVAESARGAGIGHRLLEYAERHARKYGLARVFLDSLPDAVGFYERDGYSRHGSILVRKRLD